MILSWTPMEGALMTTGSRATAIDTAWRQRHRRMAEPVCGRCRRAEDEHEQRVAS